MAPLAPRDSRVSGAAGCLGLLPERVLVGIASGVGCFASATDAFGGVVSTELAFRGDGWLEPRSRGGPAAMASNSLIFCGAGTRCTIVTAAQSAGGMKKFSLTFGGRQQPGHPGFGYPAPLSDGFCLAH